MKKSTTLRLLGVAVILVGLWAIGHYNVNSQLGFLLIFGFAGVYEWLVVRPAIKNESEPT